MSTDLQRKYEAAFGAVFGGMKWDGASADGVSRDEALAIAVEFFQAAGHSFLDRQLGLDVLRRELGVELPEMTAVKTLRTSAEWFASDEDSARQILREVADDVEHCPIDICCAVCEEVECDTGCPMEHRRLAVRREGDESYEFPTERLSEFVPRAEGEDDDN